MKKNLILKLVLVCISLCISLNARTQTTAYQTYLDNGVFSATQAPTGEVRFPAEFEPVQSVMVVYPLNLPWELLQEISEDCKLVTVVNKRKTSSTIDEIKNEYTNNGVNIDNCEFIIAKNDNLDDGINSHWIRDFGPWCIFNGKNVAIVDNVYNRSFIDDDSKPISNPSWTNGRWRDDAFAKTYATDNGITLLGMEVVHTGGNMMQDGRGVGVSDLIVHTQSETFAGLSEETVNQRMEDYLGIDPYHVTIDPQGDYIAHVDCWGKFLAPDKIIIAKVPSTHEQYSAYEEVAEYFESTNCCWGYPYKVYRVEVPVTKKSEIKAYNKIAPYTNSLILNNKVLVPISSLTSSSYNEAALDVYREAMPGYEIIGIDYIIEDTEMGNYSGWKNTDALHCRTRDIMDFNMLFVDHRNVLFGEQAYKESYPITAKFIAYSGDNITETKLHYSINGGAYTTVNMTATGNANEYAANITGHADGANIKYYVTGKDASGRTCVQPQFGELEPHTFTAGAASGEEPEQPTQPTLDITKYYRIKTTIGTNDQYLTIFDHTSNVLGQYGGVGVASLDESKVGQMFKFENAEEGKYYLKSADGYYIYCQSYNVDAIDGTQKSALWGFDYESNFELQCDNGYFKVETVNGGNYVFCNEKKTRSIATWSLEEVPVSVTISAGNNSVTVNESVQLNATAIGGTGNYTYSWSPATALDNATIANPTFTPNTTGEYIFTCTVTDNGVTATSNTVTITAEAPAVIRPEIDLTKYYRIKVNSGTFVNQYLHISNTANTVVTSAKANDLTQIFTIEDAGNGNYYLKNVNGLYIKCDAVSGAWWSIYGNATSKTPLLFEYTNETAFYIRDYDKISGASVTTNNNSDNSYFKVEKGTVYCDAPKTNSDVVTWTLEETELPLFLTADKKTITANGTDVVTFTVKQGNDAVNDATIYINDIAQTEYTFSTTTAGTYTVYAQKGTLTSESITITVNEVQQGGGDTSGDVVTIDNTTTGKNEGTSMYVPIYNNYEYSITQQYYKASEINKQDGGTITAIAFKTSSKGNSDTYTRNIEVYIVNVDEDEYLFDAKTMKKLSSSDCVFTGQITFNTESWVSIPLSSEFKYNGKNLLICVNDITGDSYVSPAAYYYTFASGEAMRCLYQRNSDSKYNPTTNAISAYSNTGNVPYIQFTFASSDTPQEPTKPTISVDKTRFTADNSDYVQFTVKPADAEIWYTTGTQNAVQLTTTDKSFKTSNAGTYSFYAMKDGVNSVPITVEAVAEDELTLTLSTNNIVANGIEEVTFIVTQDDINGTEQDVTNNCTFKINNTIITGNTFFTNRAGEYTVTASKGTKTATATLTATAVSGEENVVLIDGNVMQPAVNTSNLTVPVCNYDKYGISQQYYKASEIGKNENGIISHISFKTAKNSGTYSRNIKIYMVNTDESDFGAGKTTKQMSEDNDLVFSGSVNFTPNTWVTIELTNKFTYTANKNILVCVNDITSNNVNPISSYFDTYAKGYNDNFRTLYKNNTENAFDPTAEITDCSRVNFTPFIKFTFEKEQEVITLAANKTLIKADDTDKVSFTVTKEGLNPEVVTEESEIHISREGDQTETVITGHEFTATVAGNYTAYAMKGETKSNTVSFRAVYPITLTASTDTIIANNEDVIKFTVRQSTGQGTETIDITSSASIFIDNVFLGASENTYKTNIIGRYFVYAEYDDIKSNVVTFYAKSSINYDEDIEGSLDGEYFNPKGYITYNKGQENEYTLVARKENGKAIIIEDNVWRFGTGTGAMIELKRPNSHKPQADATLIIPNKILFDNEWVTVTEIEDHAFDNLFEYIAWDIYTPGDPLNNYFTNIIIPSTIEKIGDYTFGFNVERSIICFAPTPPAVGDNPPFLKDTYKNAIVYVPAPYEELYEQAEGWGVPVSGADKDAYFPPERIVPIETPTFYIKGSWADVNNWVPEYGYPDPGEDVIILEDARIENGTVADVGRVDIISGSITIADGGQLIHTNPGVSVTLEKEIIGYHESTSPTSWYTISSPLYPSIEASSVESLLSNDYDLYRYDEPTHYWDNIEDLEDTIAEGPHGNWTMLDAGRGYLYANQEDVTLKFKGVANHTGGTYNLTRDVWDGVLIGFHLVGNPFTHDIYMNNAFDTEATLADGYYILSNTGAWGANLGSNTPIEPCQGVLIKALTEGTLTINKKVGPAAQTRSRTKDEFISISVANNKYEDKAYVSFNVENPLEKINHQNTNVPMVYIPMEGIGYAIATMDKEVKEIPVAFEAKTMGQYTISAKAQNYDAKEMYLVDRMTGIETNLLLEDYTFLAQTSDNSERFIIKLSNTNTDSENFIFINNNEMIINNIKGNGVLQIFDVMGRYISHTEVSGSANISTEAFTNGVYIIRMTDDNGVKTQKVVLY